MQLRKEPVSYLPRQKPEQKCSDTVYQQNPYDIVQEIPPGTREPHHFLKRDLPRKMRKK